MGLTYSTFRSDSHSGRQLTPTTRMKTFPETRRKPVGAMLVHFKAVPGNIDHRVQDDRDDIEYSTDCQFVPYSDNEITTMVSAIRVHPVFPPKVISRKVQGLVCVWTISPNTLNHRIVKNSRSPSLPTKVTSHPDGKRVVYCGSGCVTVEDTHTGKQGHINSKELITEKFLSAAASPNGLCYAVLARHGRSFELSVWGLVSSRVPLKEDSTFCHTFNKQFVGSRRYTEQVDCQFSPDSSLIVLSTNFGLVQVVRKNGLLLHCDVIPELIGTNTSQLRAVAFDSRFCHHVLAVGAGSTLYVCDVDNKVVMESVTFESDVQCLTYDKSGSVLAVATFDLKIHMLSSDTHKELYLIDCTQPVIHESEITLSLNGDRHDVPPDDPGATIDVDRPPDLLSMSFSTSGEQLATAFSDGCVRVWQCGHDPSLRALCRRAILQETAINQLHKLPLPPAIILYLLQWPTNTFQKFEHKPRPSDGMD